MTEISKDMLVEDLVQHFSWTVGLLARKGIVCVQCGEPVWGTLEQAAKKAGILDLETLIGEMNDLKKPGEEP